MMNIKQKMVAENGVLSLWYDTARHVYQFRLGRQVALEVVAEEADKMALSMTILGRAMVTDHDNRIFALLASHDRENLK